MINVIENNYKPSFESTTYKTTCPHCGSVFKFELEDLKWIEKRPNGKRPIDCPCCGAEFDTSNSKPEIVQKPESLIGKIGVVTGKPDGKFKIPFYYGKVEGIGGVIFIAKTVLEVGDKFIIGQLLLS